MDNNTLINKAIEFIQKNPRDNLSLESIADNAGFSYTYFDALFKQHTGYSPVEYSRIYKLTRSALQLRRTEKTILDIALEFGYASPESYTRAFKAFYGVTPSEYRNKYSKASVDWHDMSGKISISRFKRSFPELKISTVDSALDFCFTHSSVRYGEDIVLMGITESEILTLGNPEELEHFIRVSDFNSPEPDVMIVCEKESDALLYLNLLTKSEYPKYFSLRRPPDCKWEQFDAQAEKLGLDCRYGYDMIYPLGEISVPQYDGMTVRELDEKDMAQIKAFRQQGGCGDSHVNAIRSCFDGKGNVGLRPVGLFIDNELVCLAMPVLDCVREFRKYDIGAVFAVGKGKDRRATELIWKYTVDMCLKDNAFIGNGNATDASSLCNIEISEQIGLIKVTENCRYSK